MQSARLNVLDELYLHLDRVEEPWSVHLEVHLERPLVAERLREAVAEAALRHPLARARLAGRRWEIADRLEAVSLEQAAVADLAAARERLLSRTPSLETPGPFTLLLAGDAVVLNLHHAAGDAVSALRLMTSIVRAYRGEHDPPPPADPLEARSALGRPPRANHLRGSASPARIVPDGGDARPGYGFELIPGGAIGAGATVDDVPLAALAVTIRRWNERHGADTGAVHILTAVDLRPPEWRGELLGNFAPYLSVRLAAGEHASRRGAIAAAAASRRRAQEDALPGLQAELFSPPAVLAQRMQNLIALTGNLLVDTAVLSKLNADSVAGGVRAAWFSPPSRMPLGAAIGVVELRGERFVTLRYRHALFGAGAAREFGALYREALLGG